MDKKKIAIIGAVLGLGAVAYITFSQPEQQQNPLTTGGGGGYFTGGGDPYQSGAEYTSDAPATVYNVLPNYKAPNIYFPSADQNGSQIKKESDTFQSQARGTIRQSPSGGYVYKGKYGEGYSTADSGFRPTYSRGTKKTELAHYVKPEVYQQTQKGSLGEFLSNYRGKKQTTQSTSKVVSLGDILGGGWF